MRALGICGSPRIGGNTEVLLDIVMGELRKLGVRAEKLRLCDYHVTLCTSCRYCLEHGHCCIDDDMTRVIIPRLTSSDIIVIASPVYFNDVSSYVKVFMDRT